nr:hypothetical protein Iba_chr05fCG2810 [Ipomoea batatas]
MQERVRRTWQLQLQYQTDPNKHTYCPRIGPFLLPISHICARSRLYTWSFPSETQCSDAAVHAQIPPSSNCSSVIILPHNPRD